MKLSLFMCCFICLNAGGTNLNSYAIQDWYALTRLLNNSQLLPSWTDGRDNSIIAYHVRYGSELAAIGYLKRAKKGGIKVRDADRIFEEVVASGSQQMVLALLNYGVAANGSSDLTPLMIASSKGHLEIMRILLRNGADLHASRIEGRDALIYALSNAKYHAIRLLELSGLDIKNYLKKKSSQKLVFIAIDGGALDSLGFLAVNGMNLNSLNDDGETPITYAIKRRASFEIISLLISHGSNVCKKNTDGETPSELVEALHSSVTVDILMRVQQLSVRC